MEFRITSYDIKKAFDKIRKKILEWIMNYYGFHETLIKWINRIIEKIVQVICVDSDVTKEFEAETGVRQGWPLSLLLFELYFNPLLKYLGKEINGIIIEDVAVKLNSFVDDLTTHTETEDDFKVAVQSIDKYSNIFKLQLNRNKLKCYDWETK
ncbi:hypothetical protein QYM36_014389 [Artemia franciscana]|uniref:Reverse transcriptase domain-containing protein n=1 Tax=Artemia franciscana TaxID=6661 RepID=A0AA88KVL2_ARTSF|nr:hypothetical protein QYM36_014389 [Artemia franciscana]